MINSARRRARNRGLDFNITKKDIYTPKICPVLGIELSYKNIKVGNTSPTLDRKDNSKGYIKENVFVVSWRANALKRDGTLDEFKKIITYLENE